MHELKRRLPSPGAVQEEAGREPGAASPPQCPQCCPRPGEGSCPPGGAAGLGLAPHITPGPCWGAPTAPLGLEGHPWVLLMAPPSMLVPVLGHPPPSCPKVPTQGPFPPLRPCLRSATPLGSAWDPHSPPQPYLEAPHPQVCLGTPPLHQAYPGPTPPRPYLRHEPTHPLGLPGASPLLQALLGRT